MRVFISANAFPYIADVFEVTLFARHHGGATVDPYHIAVVVGAQVEGHFEVVGAGGVGRYDDHGQHETSHDTLHVSGGQKVLANQDGESADAFVVEDGDLIMGAVDILHVFAAFIFHDVRVLLVLSGDFVTIAVQDHAVVFPVFKVGGQHDESRNPLSGVGIQGPKPYLDGVLHGGISQHFREDDDFRTVFAGCQDFLPHQFIVSGHGFFVVIQGEDLQVAFFIILDIEVGLGSQRTGSDVQLLCFVEVFEKSLWQVDVFVFHIFEDLGLDDHDVLEVIVQSSVGEGLAALSGPDAFAAARCRCILCYDSGCWCVFSAES